MVAWCNTRLKIRIYVVELGEDDPRKCTARKMVEYGYACRVRRPPRGSIILDPYAEVPLSRQDSGIVENAGITIVDASWNKLDPQRFARIVSRWRGIRRRLPILFAANPPHYGTAFKLSSLEAAAAALYITGFHKEAEQLLRLYKWGESFLKLNENLLREYYESEDENQVLEKEASLLSRILERNVTRNDVREIIKALAAKAKS